MGELAASRSEVVPHVLMLFLDGVGIGRMDSNTNPFFSTKMESLRKILGGAMIHLDDCRRSDSGMSLVPLDATLGLPGLPQSGTGQTSLFTGLDAPRIIGKHFGPYPYSTLKPVIRDHNIFAKLKALGRSPLYANAFPKQYFEYIGGEKSRVTATTMSWMMAGYSLNDSTALAAGRALSADITNERWDKLGYPSMPVISAQDAGRRLVQLTRNHDFVLFEYYFTDKAGHNQSMKEANQVLSKLDCLFEGILDRFDHREMLLLVTSDHGNLEDLSTKSHTLNPVPLLALGARHLEITRDAKNLTHVAPAILRLFQQGV